MPDSNLVATVTNGSFQRTTTWQSWRNLPESVTTVWGTTTRAAFSYSYDDAGRRDSEKLTGTLASDLGYTYGYQDGHDFNDRSEVEGMHRRQLDSSGNPTSTYDYSRDRVWSYDNIGNRLTEDHTDGTTVTTATFTSNVLNQYTGITNFLSASPSYDYAGNLTSDATWFYYYDGENRLVVMIRQDNSKRLEFTYDYMGRRVRKIVRDGSSPTSTISLDRKFIYQGWNLIAEVDGATPTTSVRNYVCGLDLSGSTQGAGGVGGLLQIQTDAAVFTPVYQANGNVRGLLDVSGNLVARYDFTAFGETLAVGGSSSIATDNPFRFSSKYTDAETGLLYYGYRYYSPTWGRFINRDPIEEWGGLNLYQFVGNRSTDRWDFLGMILRKICYQTGPDTASWDQETTSYTLTAHVHCVFVDDGEAKAGSLDGGGGNPGSQNLPPVVPDAPQKPGTPRIPKVPEKTPCETLKELLKDPDALEAELAKHIPFKSDLPSEQRKMALADIAENIINGGDIGMAIGNRILSEPISSSGALFVSDLLPKDRGVSSGNYESMIPGSADAYHPFIRLGFEYTQYFNPVADPNGYFRGGPRSIVVGHELSHALIGIQAEGPNVVLAENSMRSAYARSGKFGPIAQRPPDPYTQSELGEAKAKLDAFLKKYGCQ